MTPTPSSVCRHPEAVLVFGGAALNGAWEALATPLYADAAGGWRYLAWTRAHCTAGDVLILLAAHAVTALAFRDRQWMISRRHGASVLFITLGLAYTTWSEWLNVLRAGSWDYADGMPTVFGIGVAPLAQWVVLPPILVMIGRGVVRGEASPRRGAAMR